MGYSNNFNWELVKDYMDVDLSPKRKKSSIKTKYITFRQFKLLILDENHVNFQKEGYPKNLIGFFGRFLKRRINIKKEDY